MGTLKPRFPTLAFLLLAGSFMAGCVAAAAPADWRTWDLGAFRMRAPADLRLAAGGIDAQSGALTTAALRIDYDFGLYSDPLDRRADTLDYQSRAGTVDGLAARFVGYRIAPAGAQAGQACSGVHVPEVRSSGMGSLALTVLACAEHADGLRDVPAMLASIRFQPPARR